MIKKIKIFYFYNRYFHHFFIYGTYCLTQEQKNEPDFLIYSEFSSLALEQGDKIDLDGKLTNKGD